jgi:hypothetical protein
MVSVIAPIGDIKNPPIDPGSIDCGRGPRHIVDFIRESRVSRLMTARSWENRALGETSTLGSGNQVVELSPALACFGERLYIAWTGNNTALNVESLADGMMFSNKVTLSGSSDAAPALTVEKPAVHGQPIHLVIEWAGAGNGMINSMTSRDGRTFGGKVTSNQTAFDSLALVSPSGGTLDVAWTGVQTGARQPNFMQV